MVYCGIEVSDLENKDYKHRIVENRIKRYLQVFGAVTIEGPKWCGKTWTASYFANSEIYLQDPSGNFQNRQLAQTSPTLILDGETPRLIDEWQDVPAIWDAVRGRVDKTKEKGQFLLTGSTVIDRSEIKHSGAGRFGTIQMHPMSLYELGLSSGKVSLKDLCEDRFEPVMTGEVDLRDLAVYIARGGWPANAETDDDNVSILPKEYIRLTIENDVDEVSRVKHNKEKLRLLLRSLARNEATTASVSTLKKDIRDNENETVDDDTLRGYLETLNKLYLINDTLPFSSNVRSSVRVKQAKKRHLADPSLSCAILNMTPEMLVGDLNTFGFLFEALVERDLQIYAENMDATLYHYQDYAGREIDAIIELQNGDYCAFEIKLGANRIDEGAESLKQYVNSLTDKEKKPIVLAVICGMSNAAYKREDGVYVIPVTALKD